MPSSERAQAHAHDERTMQAQCTDHAAAVHHPPRPAPRGG